MRQYSNSNTTILAWVTAADFVTMNLLLVLFIMLMPDTVPDYFHSGTRVAVLVANLSMILAQLLFHTIIHRRLIHLSEVLANVLKLTVTQSALMFVFLKFLSMDGGFFKFGAIFLVAEYLVLCLERSVEREALLLLRKRGRNTRRVIFVGSDRSILDVYQDLVGDSSTGYRVIGYYSDQPIPGAPKAFKHIGDLSQLNADMKRAVNITNVPPRMADPLKKNVNTHRYLSTADELFCSLSYSDYDQIISIMRFCDNNIIRFFYVPRSFGNYRLNLKAERFGNNIIYTDYLEPLARPFNKFIKRAFDIVVSSIVCLCLLPFYLLIGLIIKRQSPGPIIFRQMRTGINGKTFVCYKFRSMHVNKDADEQQATKNDPRKFPFGDFMRRTNIDEFPQFFNVLRGDMSIVGPRPHMLHHTEMYGQLIDKYMVRHFCKPGITGWAQVTGYRGETKELWQMEERVKRDIWYIEHWTFWLDLRIIFLTAKSIVMPDKNAY